MWKISDLRDLYIFAADNTCAIRKVVKKKKKKKKLRTTIIIRITDYNVYIS